MMGSAASTVNGLNNRAAIRSASPRLRSVASRSKGRGKLRLNDLPLTCGLSSEVRNRDSPVAHAERE
jgi:hypothetical protein